MLEIRDKHTYEFSKDSTPALMCENGDIVRFVTLDCFGNAEKPERSDIRVDFTHTNPATGPLYIKGAKKGDALCVEILDITTAEEGICCTIQDCGALWDTFSERTRKISVTGGKASINDVSWDILPMIGVIGTAPDDKAIPTGHSFRCGGNMDSNIITKGVKVYLPVETDGALLSIGDLHASMGDGEVCGTGIEIAGTVTVKVTVIRNRKLYWPLTETKDSWYVNTNGHTADEAIRRGYAELQRLICKAYGWDETDAGMYMSLQAKISANQACLGIGENESDTDGPTFRVGCPKTDGKRLI